MFAKPISLILVFVITIINIIILLLPFMAMLLPLVDFSNQTIVIGSNMIEKFKLLVIISAFLVSFLMLFYVFLDILFGFSMRSALKKCVNCKRVKDCKFLLDVFKEVQDRFAQKSVKLYIKNSDEVNAYAISSLGRKAVVVTRGMIRHFFNSCSQEDAIKALKSIMAHEMSHLVNSDSLPSFLIIINQKATNLTSKLLSIIFNIGARIFSFMPYGGRIASYLMVDVYNIINRVMTFFNRVVVFNVYEFLRKIISRSIEYRCDMQAAKAFGGKNMSLALSLLGEGGYFTIFSTHPKTKSRIARVQHIKQSRFRIRAKFFDVIANYFSLLLITILSVYFAKLAQIDVIVRDFVKNHEAIYRLLSTLWHLINRFLS